MSPKNRDLNTLDVFPASWTDGIQEFISPAALNFNLVPLNSTTLRGVAGTNDGQASVSIGGRWRYRTTNHDVAHPGGAAGAYDVYVIGSAAVYGALDADTTDYNWYLVIRPLATPPTGNTPAGAAIVGSRIVGQVDWSGTAITGVRQFVGAEDTRLPIHATAALPTETPVRARMAPTPTANAFQIENSAGVVQTAFSAAGALLFGADVNLYRGAADILKTDDALEVAGSGAAGALRLTSTATSPAILIGGDVNLYRPSADVLKTDDAIWAAGALGLAIGVAPAVGSMLNFPAGTTPATGGIVWGIDTNLYRSAADTLRTDDSFVVGGALSALGAITGVGQTLSGTGKTALQFTDTTTATGLTIGSDVNLYRNAADVLVSDDRIVSNRALVGDYAFNAWRNSNHVWLVTAGGQMWWADGAGAAIDTNLYRSAVGVLKTDNAFQAASYAVGATALASTHLADTALLARLAGPTFSGTVSVPTAAVDNNSTVAASTAYVLAQAASVAPVMDGVAAVGISTRWARQDHVHASDTSRATVASPVFTGASFTLAEAQNVVVGTATGTKIGTAATQKLGFYNATPIVQQAQTVDLKDALINYGFYPAGVAATPLDLDAGALTVGAANISGALTHTGSTLGFLGATPVARNASWGAAVNTNFPGATSRKSLTAAYTMNDLRDVVATLVDVLRTNGLLGA